MFITAAIKEAGFPTQRKLTYVKANCPSNAGFLGLGADGYGRWPCLLFTCRNGDGSQMCLLSYFT